MFALKKYLRKQSKQVLMFLTMNAGKRVKRARELLQRSQTKIADLRKESSDTELPEAITKNHRKLENRIVTMEKQVGALKSFSDYERLAELFLAQTIVKNKEIGNNIHMQADFFKDKCEVLLMELKDDSDNVKSVFEQMNECKQMQKPMEYVKLDLLACLKEMQDEKRGKEIRNVKRKRDQLIADQTPSAEPLLIDNEEEDEEEEQEDTANHDSESEQEVDLTGHLASKKKKNRAGQQARRKLWEEQYGDGAKHLKYQDEAPGKHRITRKETLMNSGGGFKRNDQTSAVSTTSSSDRGTIESLHPSWQAKLREKQQMQLQAQKPQGKKIVFDDDGE